MIISPPKISPPPECPLQKNSLALVVFLRDNWFSAVDGYAADAPQEA